jgi:regulator of sirC expression with transglutaminase-like and TPR domain
MQSSMLTRTLYRELLRTTHQIERHTRPHSAPLVAKALSGFKRRGSDNETGSQADGLSASCQVRQAFRETPHSIDDAFAALRIGNEILSWLTVNDKLHRLAEEGADVVEGACVIADVLRREHRNGGEDAAESCLPHVQNELDAIAESIRARIKDADDATSHAGRLRTVQHVNAVLFDVLQYQGEYGNVEANSSIAEALARRRGLPITMCVLFMGVASRLGLRVGLTNFPGHVLLRLEPEGEECSAEGEECSDDQARSAAAAVDEPVAGGGAGSSLASTDLHGLYVATYGPHGPEVVEVAGPADGESGDLVACKITGDLNVPAGQQTWLASLGQPIGDRIDGANAAISPGDVLPAQVQVAEAGFVNTRLVDASIEVKSASMMVLSIADDGEGEQPPLIFHRCSADQLWFVDAFSRGQVLPVDACRHFLNRAGLPLGQHAAYLASVPPASVWARMCRNLAMYARHQTEGGERAASWWNGVESGLDERRNAQPTDWTGTRKVVGDLRWP